MLKFTLKRYSIVGKPHLFFIPLLLAVTLTSQAGTLQDITQKRSTVLDKKIKINVTNKSLTSLLELLSKSYAIDFIYIEEQIPTELNIARLDGEYLLRDVLNKILKNSGLTYFLIDDQIGLTSKEFFSSIEIDSNRQAKVFTSSKAPPDLSNYRKVMIKRVGRRLPKNFRRIYYLRRKISLHKDSLPPYDTTQQVRDSLATKETQSRNLPPKGISRLKREGESSVFLKLTPGFSKWKIHTNDPSRVDNIQVNTYDESHTAFSSSLGIESMIAHHFYIRFGIGYFFLTKSGTHTSTKINEFYYPFIQSHEANRYSYSYSYANFPVSSIVKIGNKKVYMMVEGEMAFNLILSSNMSHYPVFQNYYYSDINPLSKGSEPYHSSTGLPIVQERVDFRPLIYSFSLAIETHWEFMERSSVFFAPEINSFFKSIYSKNSPIRERPYTWGFSIGYKFNFKKV